MLYNFVDYYKEGMDDLKELLYSRIVDNHLETNHMVSDELSKTRELYPEAAVEYDRIQLDLDYRLQIVDVIVPKVEHLMQEVSPINYVSKLLSRKIVLLHGLEDDVIDCSESVELHKK